MVEVAPPSRSEGGASKRSDASGGCSGMCGVQVVLDEDDPTPSPCIPCEIRFALSRPLRFAKGGFLRPFVPPFALRRGGEQAQRCERGMLGVGAGCRLFWTRTIPSPPRASPAKFASLFRVPFASRRGGFLRRLCPSYPRTRVSRDTKTTVYPPPLGRPDSLARKRRGLFCSGFPRARE